MFLLRSPGFNPQEHPAMTQTPTPTAPHLLDPATRAVLLHSVFSALPIPPDAPPELIAAKRAAAVGFIAALDPGDPIEAMLVARYVAAHYACVAAFHQVRQGGHPPDLRLRFQGKAIALARLTASMMRDLHRRQANRRLPAVAPPARTPAPHTQPTPAAAQPARSTTPAPRPAPTTQRPAPTPPPAPDTGLTDAQLAQLMAIAEGRLETSAVALAA
jgi:hypothetical protein